MLRVAAAFAIFWSTALLAVTFSRGGRAETITTGVTATETGRRLLAAYPDHLDRIENGDLVWRDGTRMPLADTAPDAGAVKPFEAWLETPSLTDIFRYPYPAGAPAQQPAKNDDPGRARHAAFFKKMYGDCRKSETQKHLVDFVWLPKKSGQHLQVTSVNGVADKFKAVSAELDRLPYAMNVFLIPSAGTFNCRVIAGTDRMSAHGHGIAIDIAVKRSDYWRNAKPSADGTFAYRNEISPEIVAIFEKHGFIWGGRWYHYDTMHFEYRPEMLVPGEPPSATATPPAPDTTAGGGATVPEIAPVPHEASPTDTP